MTMIMKMVWMVMNNIIKADIFIIKKYKYIYNNAFIKAILEKI